MSANSSPDGRKALTQKCAGGVTGVGTTGAGSQSSGLRVAHTVLVATFR